MGTSYVSTSAGSSDPALAEAWAKMSKAERTAYLRSGAVLGVTSAERRVGIKELKKNAGGH